MLHIVDTDANLNKKSLNIQFQFEIQKELFFSYLINWIRLQVWCIQRIRIEIEVQILQSFIEKLYKLSAWIADDLWIFVVVKIFEKNMYRNID